MHYEHFTTLIFRNDIKNNGSFHLWHHQLHWSTRFLWQKVLKRILTKFGMLIANMNSVFVYHIRISRNTICQFFDKNNRFLELYFVYFYAGYSGMMDITISTYSKIKFSNINGIGYIKIDICWILVQVFLHYGQLVYQLMGYLGIANIACSSCWSLLHWQGRSSSHLNDWLVLSKP